MGFWQLYFATYGTGEASPAAISNWYRAAPGQAFVAGSVNEEAFTAGAVRGQGYVAGAITEEGA